MNRRESIKQVLEGKRSERLPRALFGAGRWAYKQTGLKIDELRQDPEGFAQKLAVLFAGLDTDIVFPGSGMNTFPAEAIGGELAFREGQAPLLSAPLIQKTEDALFLESIDIAHSPHSLALIEMISHLRDELPDRFLCATSWGPFTWGMILCEWNMLQEKTVSDREFVRQVCELGVRLSRAFFEPLVERGLIDGLVISDGAATLVPLDLYRDIVLPCERSLLGNFTGRGVGRFLHQCGNIGHQVGLYPDTDADCISLDATVNIGEAYMQYRGRLVTAGNVDVIKTVFGGDTASITRAVLNCVSAIADPRYRYILMPSCDPPPDTPLRNVKEFLSCADLI